MDGGSSPIPRSVLVMGYTLLCIGYCSPPTNHLFLFGTSFSASHLEHHSLVPILPYSSLLTYILHFFPLAKTQPVDRHSLTPSHASPPTKYLTFSSDSFVSSSSSMHLPSHPHDTPPPARIIQHSQSWTWPILPISNTLYIQLAFYSPCKLASISIFPRLVTYYTTALSPRIATYHASFAICYLHCPSTVDLDIRVNE